MEAARWRERGSGMLQWATPRTPTSGKRGRAPEGSKGALAARTVGWGNPMHGGRSGALVGNESEEMDQMGQMGQMYTTPGGTSKNVNSVGNQPTSKREGQEESKCDVVRWVRRRSGGSARCQRWAQR